MSKPSSTKKTLFWNRLVVNASYIGEDSSDIINGDSTTMTINVAYKSPKVYEFVIDCLDDIFIDVFQQAVDDKFGADVYEIEGNLEEEDAPQKYNHETDPPIHFIVSDGDGTLVKSLYGVATSSF